MVMTNTGHRVTTNLKYDAHLPDVVLVDYFREGT